LSPAPGGGTGCRHPARKKEASVLEVHGLNAGYGNLQVIWDVSLAVGEGEVVAILGPNGAGKTTLLKSIMGLVPPASGTVAFMGSAITGRPTHRLCTMGLTFIPEERNLFPAMTVQENLLMGAYTLKDLFPRLRERRPQRAGTMSGGERQMLAIARGLMCNPRMIILDEPSMGLSPENVVAVFETIERLRAEKSTILIVEQNVATTLHHADRAYVMEQGRIAMEDVSANLLGNDHVRRMYLGIADCG
jgi:branched-chain amino acid transport system ATP-binding protein